MIRFYDVQQDCFREVTQDDYDRLQSYVTIVGPAVSKTIDPKVTAAFEAWRTKRGLPTIAEQAAINAAKGAQ